MRPKGWSDLPPDLLCEIAGRLHVATDFVTFHAVCRPWRSSRDLLSGTAAVPRLLPWFHALTEKHGQSSPFKFICNFSKSTYRVLPRQRRNWVCSADGATVGYLTIKQLRPTLHDPITGAVTDLPRFWHYTWEEDPRGIVYRDGSTFLYHISRDAIRRSTIRFRAAALRPGDAEWTLVERTFETNGSQTEFCAAYRRGMFLVSLESSLWHVVTPGHSFEVSVPRPCVDPDEPDYPERSNYILESGGELLWASVQLQDSKTFLVTVHALEEATVPVRWVVKQGHCLADRVLFLGSPNSFAVKASLLGGQGGCAYFVYHNSENETPEESGLFRYSFIDGKAERIQRLPQEWEDQKCTWLVPQPTPLLQFSK
ncbi:hypothetical protein QYE76_056700 [Lolium multiflorum]|uniref:KIB1-4 beta-propeller domain-containing protein n=1 Tax=Lolium multiflorum TaxID=4521 RepID=A0AAD8T3H3_LOLMU|nr:hypothetical protein QYE76_056700 [Lolium multiflorum]